jgi:hypothetical protein
MADTEDGDVEIEEVEKGEKGNESKALNRLTDVVQDREMDANKVRTAMLKLAAETEQEKQRQLERCEEVARE